MAHLRALGRTGLTVSPIGLGTVKIGRNQGVRYPRPFDLPDDDAVRTLLRAAMDLGVNVIDTAPAYGTSEERLGRLLPGRRDQWVVVTKCGEEYALGQSSFDFSPGAVTRSVERSLSRLRMDYLDVVLIHSDGRDEQILRESGAVEALEDLRQRGLIRAVGISTKTVSGGLLAAERCDVVMITLNPFAPADAAVARAALQSGAGILVKKALASGHLGDARLGGDPVATCLSYVLRSEGVHCAIVGTLNPQHLAAAVAAADGALRDEAGSG